MVNHKITKANFLDVISKSVFAQSRHFFMVLSVLAVLVGLFFSYRLWVAKREQAAQYDFSALIAEYDAMSREKNPQWAPLLEKFEKNYEKHSSSSLLPYYQGYKVNILLKQGDKSAALTTLDSMITNMQSSPIVALYEMERALIKLDSADAEMNAIGLTSLKILAEDSNNIFRDSAQFYLGRYYWATDQIDLARTVWQQLVDEQRDEKIAASPWVNQVQELLKLTIV
jgi:predicted negative regulator of RcsB-dependent stress response